MNRRYVSYDDRQPGGGYKVASSPCPVSRPNRTAAGMSLNLSHKKARTRHEPKLSDLALRLTVRGTLDPLAGHTILTVKRACTCCGAPSGGLTIRQDGHTQARLKIRRRSLKLNPARLP